MADYLVDTNVIFDVINAATDWHPWSMSALRDAATDGRLLINEIIYAEVGAAFASHHDLDRALDARYFERADLPWEAAFLAGQAHLFYRRRGGKRERVLPDFLIGAHAAVAGLRLLTRDGSRYRGYFPGLDLIAP